MDVPEGDEGWSYSFVTSDTDPTTGYFMPIYKAYMYRVKCADSTSCSFVKVNTGYKNPHSPVTMTVQPDSGLKCPGTWVHPRDVTQVKICEQILPAQLWKPILTLLFKNWLCKCPLSMKEAMNKMAVIVESELWKLQKWKKYWSKSEFLQIAKKGKKMTK